MAHLQPAPSGGQLESLNHQVRFVKQSNMQLFHEECCTCDVIILITHMQHVYNPFSIKAAQYIQY